MSDVWGLASFVDTMHSRTALGSHARLYWSVWHVCGLLFSFFVDNEGPSLVLCRERRSMCDMRSVNDGHRHNGFSMCEWWSQALWICGPLFSDDCLSYSGNEGRRLIFVARDVWCAIFDFRWAKCEWGHRNGGFPGSVLWILSIFDVRFAKCSSRSVNEVRIASSFSPVIVDTTMPTNGRRSFCIVSDIRWAICDERLISEICEVWMRVTGHGSPYL